MGAVGRTPATRSAMLGYIPPEGASEARVARARALCCLRKNRWRPEERKKHADEETLYDLAKQHDPDGRRWKARNVLRNQEFLIALILVGEQRGDAVPPEWLEPMDHLCNSSKRSRASAFGKTAGMDEDEQVFFARRKTADPLPIGPGEWQGDAPPVQPVLYKFNNMDADRCVTTGGSVWATP